MEHLRQTNHIPKFTADWLKNSIIGGVFDGKVDEALADFLAWRTSGSIQKYDWSVAVGQLENQEKAPDIIEQFLSPKSQSVLTNAISAVRLEIQEKVERVPLQKFMEEIHKREKGLEEQERGRAQKEFPTMADAQRHSYTGLAFIKDMGITLDLLNGMCEGIYNLPTAKLRSGGMDAFRSHFFEMFHAIAQQFPEGSRVLNVGSGTYEAPVRAIMKAGHQVISTDAGKDITQELGSNTNTPTFHGDLIYLDQIMDTGSIDVITGNSVMAYVHPHKMKKVVSNLASIMKHGAVFTFDLAPGPIYFEIASPRNTYGVINATSPDPLDLLDFIERYGKEQGLHAMALHESLRNQSVHFAMLEILVEIFESLGIQTQFSELFAPVGQGGNQSIKILRVSKDAPELLETFADEKIMNPQEDYWSEIVNHIMDKGFLLRLMHLDRKSAILIARKLGIICNEKNAAWRVFEYVLENSDASQANHEIAQSIIASSHPSQIKNLIRPYIFDGKAIDQRSFPEEVIIDQSVHRTAFDGQISARHGIYGHELEEFTEDKIDEMIEKAHQKQKIIAAAEKSSGEKKKKLKKH